MMTTQPILYSCTHTFRSLRSRQPLLALFVSSPQSMALLPPSSCSTTEKRTPIIPIKDKSTQSSEGLLTGCGVFRKGCRQLCEAGAYRNDTFPFLRFLLVKLRPLVGVLAARSVVFVAWTLLKCDINSKINSTNRVKFSSICVDRVSRHWIFVDHDNDTKLLRTS
jgi:hypothetical protein